MNLDKLIADAHKFADKAIAQTEQFSVKQWLQAEYTGKNWHKVIIVIILLVALAI